MAPAAPPAWEPVAEDPLRVPDAEQEAVESEALGDKDCEVQVGEREGEPDTVRVLREGVGVTVQLDGDSEGDGEHVLQVGVTLMEAVDQLVVAVKVEADGEPLGVPERLGEQVTVRERVRELCEPDPDAEADSDPVGVPARHPAPCGADVCARPPRGLCGKLKG